MTIPFPAWYANTAIGILNQEIYERTAEKDSLEEQNKIVKQNIENLSADIEVLSNYSGILLVNEKERQIKDKQKDLDFTKRQREVYEYNLYKLGIKYPYTEEDFLRTGKTVLDAKEELSKNRETQTDKTVDLTIKER